MKRNVIKNIFMLYGLSIAKIIFPLLSLPYLTRVLTVGCYGIVAYVKTIMQYFQIIVDFGFLLSGTKDIVENKDNRIKTEYLVGDILVARVLLGVLGFFILLMLTLILPIVKDYLFYTFLSYISVFLSVFLFEYYFRGIEKMHIVTIRFILMKTVSTLMIFLLVHSDSDILLIPLLDILGMILSILLVLFELKKDRIKIRISNLLSVWKKIVESFIYFISDMATVAFGALTTVIIGIFLSSSDIAYWSVCIQLIGAIQTMYNPITNGIYPDMVKTKDFFLIKRVLLIIMPIIMVGSVFVYFVAPYALQIIFGLQYKNAYPLLRLLIPILIFSFPGMLLGWPTLGAIGKTKQVTTSTIMAALFQIIGIGVLILFHSISVVSIAIIRGLTELFLLSVRTKFCIENKKVFVYKKADYERDN